MYPLFSTFLFLGQTEIILIIVAIVILFGAKKIPELMRGIGSGVREFKDAVNGKDDDRNRRNDKEERE